MSIDNIELTPFLIQELYKNYLVEFEAPKKEEKVKPVLTIGMLGNNRSRVIIIINDAANLYLPDDQLNFLMGILAACKLTMEDVAIINLDKNQPINYKTIELELKAQKIILFGVTAEQIGLPLSFPFYQIQQYNNQTYVVAALLPIIQNDQAEKTKLWGCLKQIFIS